MEALKCEFPEAFLSPRQPVSGLTSLPSEFTQRVLHAYAHVPLSSRRWTIFHLVSNQMIPHLDAERAGLVMIYVRINVSAPHVLQFGEGAGNTCWTTRQISQDTTDEAWLVQIIEDCRPFFIQSCAISQIFPPSCLLSKDLIQSMGFFPLYRSGIAAGGLLLCSALPDFFTPLRQTLIEEYSCLVALAFNDSDFIEHKS